MGGSDDHVGDESNSNSSLSSDDYHLVKIIREYDFFDENRPCVKEHRYRLLENYEWIQETTLIPKASIDHHQHPNYDQKKRKSISDDDDSVSPGATTIRLFGADLSISSSDDRKGKQKMEVETASITISSSSKRKKILSSIGDDDDSLEVEVIGGTIIMLFGANLSISSDDDDQEAKQKMSSSKRRMRKRRRMNQENKYRALPPIPPLFHPTILQHQEPTFLFEKKLEVADVRRDQNRLFIPRSDELMGFLSQDETTMVEERNKNLIVPTRDNMGNQYTMHLTKWHSVSIIVLNRDWFKYVEANALKDGDSVQGWGYRTRGNVFRLALNIIRKQERQEKD